MENQMFRVEVNQSFNVLEQTWDNHIYLKLYVSMFASGLVAELGPERTITLLAIASFMNEKGECYPTQEQLAERLGMTRKTVAKHIQSLLKFRYEDRPLVLRDKRRNPKVSPNVYSVYTVLPMSQVAIFDSNNTAMGNYVPLGGSAHTPSTGNTGKAMGKTEPPMGKNEDGSMGNCLPTNKNQLNQNHYNKTINHAESGQGTVGTLIYDLTKPRDVIQSFCDRYRDKYHVDFNPVWGRDVKRVKTDLLATYSTDQIQQLVDTYFEEYDQRWRSKAYPRPAIGSLCWLAPQVLAVAQERQPRCNVKKHGGRNVDEILARLQRGSEEE
ncbi:hypothetical protein GTO91_02940 [Heliobacterium undosum]|uniref:Helix-turn-helix domain-containing protein n=1 Tax=Heliomicrobium undosum TaxID=121734 RepID=A0A845L148_9FIRM|nr:helix-turn-helix domain-containing protein [Heliomicrobium undosum]MZP28675.1 hypothetical protein [Heliomicrobium undosum]